MFQPNPELVSEPATQDTPVAALLRRAKALIATPAQWCQHALYNGHAYCLLGALRSVEMNATDADKLLWKLAGNFVHFNDTHTHAEVLDLLSRAIEAANGR